MNDDGQPVTHRRRHWAVEPELDPVATTMPVDRRSPDESRRDAKVLLWRDSAIILIGVVLAILAVNYLPGLVPGLAASETDPPFQGGPGGTLIPGGSLAPGETFGPVIDPGLGIDATQRPGPAVTLPPTGSFAPGDPNPTPTPRPTRKPPATIKPATPPPTAPPTPEITPEITEPPPPPTVSLACQVTAPLTVSCDATVSNIKGGSQVWSSDGAPIAGGDGSNSITWLYLEAGQHTITITVTGDDGSFASDSQQVDVPGV